MAKNRGLLGMAAAWAGRKLITAAMGSAYDGASFGRRLSSWRPSGSGPNKTLYAAGNLRNRARDMSRNEWSGHAIPTRWASNLVGTGIISRPKTTDAKLKKKLVDLWDASVEVMDADGVLDLYGLQSMAARSWIESGEVFVRLRPRRLSDGFPVPMQIQLIEADQVPNIDQIAPNGNQIRCGIEFDFIGRRVAYWMYREHPGEGRPGSGELIRVPAENVLHIYEPTRPGQLRGVSEFAPIMAKLRSVNNFDDAVLSRQEIANLFAAFVETAMDSNGGKIDPLSGQAPIIDRDGHPMASLEPGTVQELDPGTTVKFSDPPDSGSNYSDYMRNQHLGVAAGVSLPYELLTGDLKDVSDRTLRVMINEFRRHCQQRQWHILIPQFCRPIRNFWADQGFISGVLTADEYAEAKRVTYVPQGWDYIHPTQDVQARKMEVDAGFRARSDVITERGDDPDHVDEQRAHDKEREKNMGLAPEKVTKNAQ